MGLPRKLKNMNMFNDGVSYLGEATSVTLPKLVRKMEDFRAAGMDAPVKIDFGMEPLEMETTCGGLMFDVLGQFGATTHDAAMLRYVGAYQRDDSGDVDAVEITVRGRHQEVDMGDAKPGDDTEFKFKTALSYYRLEVNGREVVLIDVPNMVARFNGVDRLAAQRNALGGLSGDIAA